MACPIRKADKLERGRDHLLPPPWRNGRYQQRKFDIFRGAEDGDEIKGLEDESDVLISPIGKSRLVEFCNIDSLHMALAASRSINAGNDMKQSGLAGSGGPHQSKKLSEFNV
jgi:hypothetical protein